MKFKLLESKFPTILYHSVFTKDSEEYVDKNGITTDENGHIFLSKYPIINKNQSANNTVACYKVKYLNNEFLYDWRDFFEDDFDHTYDDNNPYYIYTMDIPKAHLEKIYSIEDINTKSNNRLDDAYFSMIEYYSDNIESLEQLVHNAAEKAFRYSKVRDKDGNLLKVYHYTNNTFTVFDDSNDTHYFSPFRGLLPQYGEFTHAFYLNIKNMVSYDLDLEVINGADPNTADGSVYLEEDIWDCDDFSVIGETEYWVPKSRQIKSADIVTRDDNGNIIPLSKRFDFTKDDVRY